MKGEYMENDELLENIDSLLNPKDEYEKSEIDNQKKIYKKLILEDVKGKGFEFKGKLTLEIKGDTLIVKATS